MRRAAIVLSTASSLLTALLLAVPLGGCQQSAPAAPAKGAVLPTVAGGSGATFPDLAAARAAFTRTSGSITATLEDAAWIRFEAQPEEAERRHRAYFEYGYTTFEVTLRSKGFTQPTAEEFVLEDSSGARHPGHPLTYQGAMKLEDNEAWTNRFTLSFPHVITKDLAWIRLKRPSDESVVEWSFGPGGVSTTR